MNELKFNSQICTSVEQSKRLLELGLRSETADMELIYNIFSKTYEPLPKAFPIANKCEIPAWSLHRLIEMCGIDRMPISFHKKGKIRIRVNHIHPTHEGRSGYNHYNSLIDCIEWLISENYFNKEYLKQ